MPVEGDVGSRRLPSFQRLDVNLNYYIPLNADQNVVIYLEVINLLNRNNVMDISYNADYSRERKVFTNYARSVYMGVNITL